ncbi:MAG: ABC transporter permease [Acidobacteria bacterium]|nr:ABC transporter permease [Acidobacteriota bacterium]
MPPNQPSRIPSVARWADELKQDLRYTARTLGRQAGFTTFAILIIGLGIGATSTIYSVVDAFMLRPLPVEDPARLVWVANGGAEGSLSGQTTQVGHLLDLRERNQSFADLSGYFAFCGVGDSTLTGAGEPERLSEVPVSRNFFPVLGVKPMLGRMFSEDEAKWNGPRAVLLSHGLWKRRFASDSAVVGRNLTLNNEPVAVIGVLPESFDFASIFAPGSKIDLFSAFPLSAETNRWGNTMAMVGRLKPGVDIRAARAEVGVLAQQITAQHPERNGLKPALSSLEQHVRGRVRPAVWVLACAVGAVMLIVCANLSNLQLARTAARQKEMAIRAAMGAARRRLIRQMLTESVALSCCGALLGILLAVAGTRTLAHLDGMNIPLLESVRVDPGVLGFTLSLAVLTGLIFGMAPALHAPSAAPYETLKDSVRGASAGRGHAWVRSALVVCEISFACVLLVAAGLLIRSFLRVLDVNLGFQPDHAVAMRIDPDRSNTTRAQRNAYFDEALRIVKSIPGVQAAGMSDALPLGRNRTWGAGAKGQVYERGKYPLAFVRIVSDGYFAAMGIPLRAGRDFTPRDSTGTKAVVIINETLARTLWPGQDPLGKMMNPDREVVGVVGDVRHVALEQGSGSEMYLPIRQGDDYPSVDLVVRSSAPVQTLGPAVRAALRPINPNLPANDFRTIQTLVDRAVSPRRFIVVLLGAFAGFALALASLGVYGVVSYSVEQRTQEIGIRMALGASAGTLRMSILGETMGLAGIGLAIGLAASFALARAMSGLLFGVTASDPTTFAAILLVLAAVAALAGYLPALRASRIDPARALRSA